jgi:N-hydroxyarylamine O-acetyltransferase
LNVDEILNRIEYTGSREPSLDVLIALQHAYLYTVPFENLDIHARVKIKLDIPKFYEKIILNHRGGFCYESNALFSFLLDALGFDVSIIAAKMTNSVISSPGYSHMALKVSLDQDYLVDVGNGKSVRDPMPIPGDVISQSEGIRYKVGQSPASIFTQQRLVTLATPNGRITLTGDTLTISQDGKEEAQAIETKERMEEILNKYFKISVQLPDY